MVVTASAFWGAGVWGAWWAMVAGDLRQMEQISLNIASFVASPFSPVSIFADLVVMAL